MSKQQQIAEATARAKAADAERVAVRQAAEAKGLQAFVAANTGYVRGSSWDSVIKVSGNTFACKDSLKAHGARWHSASKSWVFASAEEFFAAMAAI